MSERSAPGRGSGAPHPDAGLEAATKNEVQHLPSDSPVRFVTPDGELAPRAERNGYEFPSEKLLLSAYRAMVVGRRFNTEATALTKMGRLAVYPSSRGQEACQVGGVVVLDERDWLFPTYRDTVALISRGIDPVEALGLLRGDWHCGYDPMATRTAPQCTPLATHMPHAVGLAYAARRRGEDLVAMVYVGDGGTSEGDFHEALNFAAVFNAPVVFLVQNNRYAISVPLSRQSAAPSLAHKGVGYGIRSEQVDGNDAVAVVSVLSDAVAFARTGRGPVLVEAHTYRMDAHTNADPVGRYRDASEAEEWIERDPMTRLEAYLSAAGVLTDSDIKAANDAAEDFATGMRPQLNANPEVHPLEIFDYVFAEPTPQLREQRSQLEAELAQEA
ncbi:thiamine pyrophosphate-dependent dehydrogenase E1 component subunit alpha [Phytoactinopolyspora mesophila]|uniref:2-oxoisovalerate dehydrogenase subunit alpha n=1 Tax=Phytoactinopolyspora mesophila TaxID=2650750 RepID=A0A7K3MAX2_9ACTN|nr:thiamine pyrophosphate-dependent dehydrogenase E1 component subunit alpha [Phytoactinopolyspora mesophila]NDL60433.1 pyruvate dehydrogenase (acetyl-transferring) E1 component subunit alpha [Phytoactinopolyspora mesophila]